MLTFEELSRESKSRAIKWQGSISNWTLSEWAIALVGEVGEACNIIKKLNRDRDGVTGNKGISKEELQVALAEELADAMIYLDLLCTAADIDLESVICKKFNDVSERFGFPERLHNN